MKQADNINEFFKNAAVDTNPEMDEAVLDQVLAAHEKTNKVEPAFADPLLRRTIMKSPIAGLAASAVILVAALLVLATFPNRATTPAYALVQTREANHSIRSIHVKGFEAGHNDNPIEVWIECDEFGKVKNARLHLPGWLTPEKGAQVVVWKEGKMQIWLTVHGENVLFVVRDKAVADQMLQWVNRCDPRRAVERLHQRQQRHEVSVRIDQPSNRAEPIVIRATHLPKSPTPDCREVFFVDPNTKLVVSKEQFELRDGRYEYQQRIEYHDYNQTIPDEIFRIEEELPADVIRVDQTTQKVGLPQEQLSAQEVAVEVVRQSMAALIAKDYVKAGKLLAGMPADLIEREFGHIKFLRIVSIGPAAPHPVLGTEGFVVPCTVEIEKNGRITQWTLDQVGVRQVYNQPGRWTIFGGFGVP